jgi:hypothetical protein
VSTWRCRGCLSMNASRTRKCAACKKARPKRRRPAHLKALDVPYADYVVLNGGKAYRPRWALFGGSARRVL